MLNTANQVPQALGFNSIKDSVPKNIDKSIGKFEKLSDFANLNQKERSIVFDRFNYPLSGYTNDKGEPKVSIWGKIIGYDDNFSTQEIKELKNFINDSKILGTGFDGILFKGLKNAYSADELYEHYKPLSTSSFLTNEPLVKLLDSDLSVDEFKIQWAKYTLKERFNLDLKDDDAKNAISILNELKQKDNPSQPKEQPKDDKFKPMQVVRKSKTYKDEATSEIKKLYELIQREFNQGKDIFTILKKVAKRKIDIKA